MHFFTEISSIKNWIQEKKKAGKTIGFVPTMGYLHEGHLSLIQQAKKENDVVIISVFVNPLQFGEGEDFEQYPRDIDRDSFLAKENGVDVLFHPTVTEMYPTKMSAILKVQSGTDVLCGASRPGHFDGVATVVMKLFGITSPDRAYFGMKDAQQVAVIERLVMDYHLDVKVVRGATVREEDGLAKSSRNVNLTWEERKEAPTIYEILTDTKERALNQYRDMEEVDQFLLTQLTNRLKGTIDYAEVRTYPFLEKNQSLQGEIIIAVAVKYSKVRLIDNIIFTV
ncbi:pantoate--beta-alanine ligase [Evansella sp. AB-rgal1]|uniref:pantoate--beta-alanine ligase n=1 Tax=Evansella sp. AB-rgal1 TaxID=3242696 RepID=UPI00359D89CD